MSHIRFDNGETSVLLRGAERHWMASVVSNVAMSALGIFDQPEHPHWTRRTLPEGHYVLRETYGRYEDAYRTWLRVGHASMRHPVTGEMVDSFAVTLNTAYALGSTPVRLAARLHGQCEIHAFIPPRDACLMAGVIDTGRKIGLYREGMGWEGVATLLRASAEADRAVVTSYSVTETFPGWNGEKDEPNEWAPAFAALHPTNAITDRDWDTFYFGDGATFMSLEAEVRAETSLRDGLDAAKGREAK